MKQQRLTFIKNQIFITTLTLIITSSNDVDNDYETKHFDDDNDNIDGEDD